MSRPLHAEGAGAMSRPGHAEGGGAMTRPSLHPALRWGLLATLLATAWLAIRPPPAAGDATVAATVPATPSANGAPAAGAPRAAPAPRPAGETPLPAGWPAGPRERTQRWPLVAESERRAWGAIEGDSPAPATPAAPAARPAATAPTAEAGAPMPDWRLVGQLALAGGAIASTLVRGNESVVALPGEALDPAWSLARAEAGAVLLVARGPGAAAAEHWLRLPEPR